MSRRRITKATCHMSPGIARCTGGHNGEWCGEMAHKMNPCSSACRHAARHPSQLTALRWTHLVWRTTTRVCEGTRWAPAVHYGSWQVRRAQRRHYSTVATWQRSRRFPYVGLSFRKNNLKKQAAGFSEHCIANSGVQKKVLKLNNKSETESERWREGEEERENKSS